MKWFKKWLQEKYHNPSKNERHTQQGGNKCNTARTNDCRSRMTLSRESLYESSDKNVQNTSSDHCTSSSSSSLSTRCDSMQDINANQISIQSSLKQQAKSLETLISGPIASAHSINAGQGSASDVIVDPDEFFDNPDDIRLYREQNAFLDEYVIIDVKEIEAIKRSEYQTTEFCEDNTNVKGKNKKKSNKPSIVPSVIPYQHGEFCLFYAATSYEPSYSLSLFPEIFYYRTFNENFEYGPNYYRPKKRKPKTSTLEEIVEEQFQQIPVQTETTNRNLISSAEILEEKIDALEKSLMGPLINELPTPIAKSTDKYSIQKCFGLNDDGDIVMNVDHIVEERGYGFVMESHICTFRSIEIGDDISQKLRIRLSIVAFLKKLFRGLSHPRNKANSGGPGESVSAYALSLAADSTSTFSRNIENFIACTKESREVAPQVVMRNMRQFMSGMKNYLVKHGEGNFQQEVFRARSRLKPDEFLNLDTILEGVMHQLVVLPLREYLYGLSVDFYTRTSDIQLLVENVKYASARSAVDFGIRPSVMPPSQTAMQHISLLILRLQEAELPLEKLEYLLAVVSAIFETTTHPRGQALGADDFLPLLVFIVAKCGFIGAEIEAEFMWSLLQQSLLNGEAGYYLTALCSAVHVLKTFMASESEGTGSLDIRSSSLPACSSVLRVIIPDEYNGSLQTRTLPVRPHTTTREVCRTIAHKARITNPQDYGLFKLVDGEETLLMDNDCPQEARLAARGKHCMLAYKRIDAKIAWPTMTSN